MHDEQVVAADTDVPRGVELAGDAGVGFEESVGGVVGGAGVGFALFVDALRDVSGCVTKHFGDVAKEVVDDVAPVTVHIDDHATTVFGTIVPRGALRWTSFVVTGEDPVTELATDAEDVTEESFFFEFLEGDNAWEPELVLHGAVLDAGLFGDFGDGEGLVILGGSGLFAIDVLACGNGFFEKLNAVRGARGVEEDLVVRIGEGCVEVGGVALNPVFLGQRFDLFGIASSQDRVGHDGDIAALNSALFADGENGADEVLIGAHASGDAVHDDSDFFDHLRSVVVG